MPVTEYSVGTSTLKVVPDFTGTEARVRAISKDIAKQLQDAIRDGLKNGLGNSGSLQASAAKVGASVGGTLADQIRGRLQAALRALPEPKIGAATTEAEQKVRDLREQIATLSARVGVDLNSEQAAAQIAALEAQLKTLSESATDLDIKANTQQATRALELIRREIDRIKGTEATVTVEANVGSFTAQVRRALERAQAALPKIEITASTTPAQRELDLLRTRLETLSGRTIGVDISAEDALAELGLIETQLTELGARTTEVDVDVNASAAAAALAAVRAQVEQLSKERVVVQVTANLGRFVTTVQEGVAAAQASIRDLRLTLDSSQAEVDLNALRLQLAALGSKRIGVDIDAAAAQAEVTRIRKALDDLARKSPDVTVRVDAAAASADLKRVEAEVRRLDGRTARVDVDGSSLNTFTGRILLIGTALASLAPAAIPAAGATVVALGAIGAAAGAVLPTIAALVLGFSGVGDAVSALSKRDEDAAKTAQTAAKARASAAQQVVSAQRALEGAEASLANARASAAASATRAAQAVAQAQQGVIDAEKAKAEAVADAAQRQIDANDALILAESEAAYAAEQSSRRVADAEKAVETATVNAQQAIADAEQRAADARQNVVDVTERASDRISSALKTYESAERSLADQQQRSLDLEKALADARQSASESLEDQQLRLVSNALRAQQQQLDLADAVANLAKVQADPKSSAADIARANLAVQQQRQAIAELEVSNKRLEAQYRAAAAAGVEGSEAVKDAQQAIADNAESVATAEQNVADTRTAYLKAQEQAERDIAAAQRSQAEAIAAVAKAQTDGAQSIADAQQNLADAQVTANRQAEASVRAVASANRDVAEAAKAATDAQVNGSRSVSDAQQRVADAITSQTENARSSAASIDGAVRGLEGSQDSLASAYAATAVAGTTAADDVATAFAKLSPAGADFATFLYGLSPQLDRLKAAAQGAFLPGLQTAITNLLPLMPVFEQLLTTFGTALGQLAIDAADGLNSAPFLTFFDFLNTNGAAIVDTAGKIVGNLALIFPALANAFGPIGQEVGDVLVGILDKFVDFLNGLQGSEAFGNFLAYVKETGPVFTSFLASFADAFVQLIKSAAPFGPIILKILSGVLDFIASLPPGVIAGIVLALLGIVAAVNVIIPVITFLVGVFEAVSGVIAAISAGAPILGTILAALGGPVTVITLIVVALVAAFVAAYTHSETFRDIVNGVFGAVRDFFVAAWEQGIKPVFDALVTFFTQTIPDAAMWLWHNGIEPAFEGIKTAVDLYITGVRAVLDGLVWFWNNVLKPAALFLWHNVFEPVFNGIKTVVDIWWQFLKLEFDLLVYAWKNYIEPAALFLWHNVFEPVFAGIASTVKGAWENVIKPALDGLVSFWKNTVEPAALFLRDNVFKPVFEGIGTTVKTVWETVLKPALDALSGFFTNTLGPAVSTGVQAFKDAFTLMQAAAAEPINFIIREVYTGGIKKLFDKVAETVGSDARLPDIAEVSVPEVQHKATGGRIAGFSPTKTADNIPIMATANEFMQPVDSVRYYGQPFMEAIRRRAIPREVLGFKAGGLIPFAKHIESIGYTVSEHPLFGGVTPGAHAVGSQHYNKSGPGGGGAVDVNSRPGTSKLEQDELGRILPSLANQYGLRSIFMYPGHYNHGHADIADSANLGAGSGLSRTAGSLIAGAADLAKNGFDAALSIGSSIKDSAVSQFDSIKSSLGSAWSSATDILSPFTDALSSLTDGVGDSPFGQLAGSAVTKVVGLVKDWVKGAVAGVTGSSGDTVDVDNAPTSAAPGVEKWRTTALRALELTGSPTSWITSLLRRMNQESGGNPNAINNWDSNAKAGHPSKGLMQTIDSTFKAYALPGFNSNVYDPLSNIIASIRYAAHFDGNATHRWDRKGGYATGGPITELSGLIGNKPGQAGRPLLFDDGGRLPVGLSVVANRTAAPEAVFNRGAERALLEQRAQPVAQLPTQVFGDVYPSEAVDVDLLFKRAQFAMIGGGLGG